MPSGTIFELWRYPIKSMRGEPVEQAAVTERGLAGDRTYAVVDAESGKVASAKHPRLWGGLLHCAARYLSPPGADAPAPVAIELPDGTEVRSDDPEVDRRLSVLLGRPVRLTATAPEGNSFVAVWPDGVMPDEQLAAVAIAGDEAEGTLAEHPNAIAAPAGTFFDVAALHLLAVPTLTHLRALQPASRVEVARYRPNVLLEGDLEPFAENGWAGATVRLGPELAALVIVPTMRCIMTTLAQADLPRDNEILRTLGGHNRIEIPGLGRWSCAGAYASVASTGRVAAGDEWAIE
ncbi:MAG TPA: MOSC N-terminal beta barrel domain-containing protein [Acidimicrobiales bacterium]|nr:MOSC N-terminal beta barrel domain-containing protein [Acidimicrobiales bacterium]